VISLFSPTVNVAGALPAGGGILVRDGGPRLFDTGRLHLRFALQERDLGFATPESAGEAARARAETIGALVVYPYLAEVVTKLPDSGYDPATEFTWGLDLILDGLDRLRRRA
jgi:hypothetical protein